MVSKYCKYFIILFYKHGGTGDIVLISVQSVYMVLTKKSFLWRLYVAARGTQKVRTQRQAWGRKVTRGTSKCLEEAVAGQEEAHGAAVHLLLYPWTWNPPAAAEQEENQWLVSSNRNQW